MACCGRGKNKTPPTVTRAATPPATTMVPKNPPPPAMPVARPQPANQPAPIHQKAFSPQPKAIVENPSVVPSATENKDELPKCRYREFRSKQLIGGRSIETYFCKAFSMSVRAEHCKACQKHDK